MRILVIGLIAALALMMVSCGGAPKTGAELAKDSVEEAPGWYEDPPSDENFLYAPTTATSLDMQLATNKAKQEGMEALTAQLEAKVEGLTKRFQEETGIGEDAELLSQYEQVGKTVISSTISGARIDKQEVMTEGTVFRSYVLMQLPWGQAQADMLAKIKSNNHLYTRFRASEAFKDLEGEVEKFEQYKKEQGL